MKQAALHEAGRPTFQISLTVTRIVAKNCMNLRVWILLETLLHTWRQYMKQAAQPFEDSRRPIVVEDTAPMLQCQARLNQMPAQ